ncbi:cryptochrome/photolyase family protein [uncultured Lentibacter sp.]|uniref:cryptochrome/photolyase family protein n=1 Tax=uncultured Lentibacter sp. TaxID=1659309 RepID=UPI00262028C8|nr:cryptochrome/photolyase family protein [uncultured Lentibacter sp.]
MGGKDLVVVLGDQLSHGLSALKASSPKQAIVVMAEVAEEAGYVNHHQKKLAFVFSAMRHFALELRAAGWEVVYHRLDDPHTAPDLPQQVRGLLAQDGRFARVLMTQAGEQRLAAAFDAAAKHWPVPLSVLPDKRFLASHADFANWAEGRKQLRMEYFYREMRRKTGLLMQGDQPEGGQWNFDADNRKAAKPDLFMPEPPRTQPDAITQEVLEMVAQTRGAHFGQLLPFWFAVDRAGALEALEYFASEALPRFGDYQDAMLRGQPFLYHSVLAQYINIGLLEPLEVCRRVERAYYEGQAPLNAVEGFIRQIIGWREYMRGIYWLNPEGYTDQNHLGATRPLPDFYWTGKTDMACMAAAIGQTIEHAYAHHIQRLMVTGNFAMLAGLDPKEVHEWYLAVYADAYEWVEAPNVIGMSQFADGGFLGSKPYAASGNYINKMSDYCAECRYSVSQKTGDGACPFNALYWDFLARNEDKLRGNPRLGQMYATWGRMSVEKREDYRASAAAFLESL